MNHHEAVFLDASSLTNYLAAVPLGSLDLVNSSKADYLTPSELLLQLRLDAERTLDIPNQPTFSGDLFTEVFLKDSRDLWTRFDVVLR